MRSAAIALWALTALLAGPVWAETVISAQYDDPTGRYDHGILGDKIEWGALVMQTDEGRQFRLTLSESRVFEDVAPRIISVPGEAPVVAVVETDLSEGARLALYRETGLVAATPFIGHTHRWLAPIGAADLDGDGKLEFAYVDRPHLAKTIRVWRYESGTLTHLADLPGFANHRIGEDNIAGGIRDCGQGSEMIVAGGDWKSIFAVTFQDGTFVTERLGPHKDRSSFAEAMACR